MSKMDQINSQNGQSNVNIKNFLNSGQKLASSSVVQSMDHAGEFQQRLSQNGAVFNIYSASSFNSPLKNICPLERYSRARQGRLEERSRSRNKNGVQDHCFISNSGIRDQLANLRISESMTRSTSGQYARPRFEAQLEASGQPGMPGNVKFGDFGNSGIIGRNQDSGGIKPNKVNQDAPLMGVREWSVTKTGQNPKIPKKFVQDFGSGRSIKNPSQRQYHTFAKPSASLVITNPPLSSRNHFAEKSVPNPENPFSGQNQREESSVANPGSKKTQTRYSRYSEKGPSRKKYRPKKLSTKKRKKKKTAKKLAPTGTSGTLGGLGMVGTTANTPKYISASTISANGLGTSKTKKRLNMKKERLLKELDKRREVGFQQLGKTYVAYNKKNVSKNNILRKRAGNQGNGGRGASGAGGGSGKTRAAYFGAKESSVRSVRHVGGPGQRRVVKSVKSQSKQISGSLEATGMLTSLVAAPKNSNPRTNSSVTPQNHEKIEFSAGKRKQPKSQKMNDLKVTRIFTGPLINPQQQITESEGYKELFSQNERMPKTSVQSSNKQENLLSAYANRRSMTHTHAAQSSNKHKGRVLKFSQKTPQPVMKKNLVLKMRSSAREAPADSLVSLRRQKLLHLKKLQKKEQLSFQDSMLVQTPQNKHSESVGPFGAQAYTAGASNQLNSAKNDEFGMGAQVARRGTFSELHHKLKPNKGHGGNVGVLQTGNSATNLKKMPKTKRKKNKANRKIGASNTQKQSPGKSGNPNGNSIAASLKFTSQRKLQNDQIDQKSKNERNPLERHTQPARSGLKPTAATTGPASQTFNKNLGLESLRLFNKENFCDFINKNLKKVKKNLKKGKNRFRKLQAKFEKDAGLKGLPGSESGSVSGSEDDFGAQKVGILDFGEQGKWSKMSGLKQPESAGAGGDSLIKPFSFNSGLKFADKYKIQPNHKKEKFYLSEGEDGKPGLTSEYLKRLREKERLEGISSSQKSEKLRLSDIEFSSCPQDPHSSETVELDSSVTGLEVNSMIFDQGVKIPKNSKTTFFVEKAAVTGQKKGSQGLIDAREALNVARTHQNGSKSQTNNFKNYSENLSKKQKSQSRLAQLTPKDPKNGSKYLEGVKKRPRNAKFFNSVKIENKARKPLNQQPGYKTNRVNPLVLEKSQAYSTTSSKSSKIVKSSSRSSSTNSSHSGSMSSEEGAEVVLETGQELRESSRASISPQKSRNAVDLVSQTERFRSSQSYQVKVNGASKSTRLALRLKSSQKSTENQMKLTSKLSLKKHQKSVAETPKGSPGVLDDARGSLNSSKHLKNPEKRLKFGSLENPKNRPKNMLERQGSHQASVQHSSQSQRVILQHFYQKSADIQKNEFEGIGAKSSASRADSRHKQTPIDTPNNLNQRELPKKGSDGYFSVFSSNLKSSPQAPQKGENKLPKTSTSLAIVRQSLQYRSKLSKNQNNHKKGIFGKMDSSSSEEQRLRLGRKELGTGALGNGYFQINKSHGSKNMILASTLTSSSNNGQEARVGLVGRERSGRASDYRSQPRNAEIRAGEKSKQDSLFTNNGAVLQPLMPTLSDREPIRVQRNAVTNLPTE